MSWRGRISIFFAITAVLGAVAAAAVPPNAGLFAKLAAAALLLTIVVMPPLDPVRVHHQESTYTLYFGSLRAEVKHGGARSTWGLVREKRGRWIFVGATSRWAVDDVELAHRLERAHRPFDLFRQPAKGRMLSPDKMPRPAPFSPTDYRAMAMRSWPAAGPPPPDAALGDDDNNGDDDGRRLAPP